MTGYPVLQAASEAAYRRFLALVDKRVGNGFRIPCRGPESTLWVSEQITDQRVAAVECGACPVRTECREYALAFPETAGVWGGTTSKERKRGMQQEAA